MKRCMFVDDSSVIRKVAKRILGGPDMLVIEAATGFDALEHVRGRHARHHRRRRRACPT